MNNKFVTWWVCWTNTSFLVGSLAASRKQIDRWFPDTVYMSQQLRVICLKNVQIQCKLWLNKCVNKIVKIAKKRATNKQFCASSWGSQSFGLSVHPAAGGTEGIPTPPPPSILPSRQKSCWAFFCSHTQPVASSKRVNNHYVNLAKWETSATTTINQGRTFMGINNLRRDERTWKGYHILQRGIEYSSANLILFGSIALLPGLFKYITFYFLPFLNCPVLNSLFFWPDVDQFLPFDNSYSEWML